MEIYGYSHLHTKYSDGDLDLPEIKKLLLKQGASFAFISEHEEFFNVQKYEALVKECRVLSDDQFLFIPGLEIAVSKNHILVLGAWQYHKTDNNVNLLKAYKADDCLLIWAHPHRGHYQIKDDVLNLMDGMEIWNSSYDTKYFPRHSSLSYAKRNLRTDWLLISGLDFHRASHLPGPKMFLSVNDLSYEEIIKKIKSGEYQIGNQKKLIKEDVFGKKYYYYCLLSVFFLGILKTFKIINSVLLALNIRMPAKIKNYLRKYI